MDIKFVNLGDIFLNLGFVLMVCVRVVSQFDCVGGMYGCMDE